MRQFLRSLLFGLSVRTIYLRGMLRIPIGDGGNQRMLRAMRVHANFAECVPLMLLSIFMLELSGGSAALVHGLCVCVLAGRVLHAFGVSAVSETMNYRVAGMVLTFAALVGSAIQPLLTPLLGG
jgi:uncharacterized membrane protein YecN with MAPEG domain